MSKSNKFDSRNSIGSSLISAGKVNENKNEAMDDNVNIDEIISNDKNVNVFVNKKENININKNINNDVKQNVNNDKNVIDYNLKNENKNDFVLKIKKKNVNNYEYERATFLLKPETIKQIDKIYKKTGMKKNEFMRYIIETALDSIEIE